MGLKAALFLLFGCAGAAQAAPDFSFSGSALSTAAVFCVAPSTGGYRMYYSSETASFGSAGVLSAWSGDGVSWAPEGGVRISTGHSGADASSVTAMGFYYDTSLAAGPYKAYYVGRDASGKYSVLSATSSDGLSWGKVAGFSMQFGGGAYVGSPAPLLTGSGRVTLYYVRDPAGLGSPADFRAYYMTSSDGGHTFSGETPVFSGTPAYAVAVSTLTDGRVRLHLLTTLASGSTAAAVISAVSLNGVAFSSESGIRLSTTPAHSSMAGLAVVRATDTFSWLAYSSLRGPAGSTQTVHLARAVFPALDSVSPGRAFVDDASADFSVSGEVFSATAPAVTLTRGSASLTVTGVTRNSDMSLTVRTAPAGFPLGWYDMTVTNTDGSASSLPSAVKLDYRAGEVSVRDNLFRPAKGGSATVNVKLSVPGNLTIRAYTASGGLVKTVYEGPAPAGTSAYSWAGDIARGGLAASGLYLLHVNGPKLDETVKVVVIK